MSAYEAPNLYGPWQVGEYEVRITLERVVRLTASRDGETLKRFPNALRRSGEWAWLQLTLEAARAHVRTTRELLERMMVEETPLSVEDLAFLALDALGRVVLERLILQMQGVIGRAVVDEWLLEGVDGNWYRLEAPLVVVHPIRLKDVELQSCDRWLNRQTFDQPFKQIRRELYWIDAVDFASGYSTSRWADEEVRWDQGRALLTSRGWHRITKSGAERHFSSAGITAYCEFRTPTTRGFDSEHVLLHRIFFLPRGQLPVNKERPGLPLADVDPIVFSETVRDIGLVGRVAGAERHPLAPALPQPDTLGE